MKLSMATLVSTEGICHNASALRKRLTEWLCVLQGGHDELMRIENGRLFLECVTCRRQSPGFTTGKEEACP